MIDRIHCFLNLFINQRSPVFNGNAFTNDCISKIHIFIVSGIITTSGISNNLFGRVMGFNFLDDKGTLFDILPFGSNTCSFA